MNEPWHIVVERVHASCTRFALVVTGGGSSAIAELLRVPGGSRTLIEAVVPYDQRALSEYLGFEPQHACSVETAVAMARRARDRAVRLTCDGSSVFGVGTTASLVSDRPKKGEHRCHIAVATDNRTSLVTIVLERGKRDRRQEEEIVGLAMIACIAGACGVDSPGIASLLGSNDKLTQDSDESADWISRLVRGEVDRITVLPHGQVLHNAASPKGVLAGSFNPLHEGHVKLYRTAAGLLGSPPSFEISVTNVDKPPLGADTLRRRLRQFAWWTHVELTRAATFSEKSRLFPEATFVVGVDTARRIIEPSYYEGESNMLAVLRQIRERGCKFLVAARVNAAGQLQSLADLTIAEPFRCLFQQIPPDQFRVDVSSTSIRAQE
jgi:nicotinamide mononucleotide (NMN) deamidase PncC